MFGEKTFEQTWRSIVDGSTRGPVAFGLRALARVASSPYSLATRVRNFAFDVGLKRSFELGRPTIAVGNLTVGGVGKTPFVGWLTKYFLDAGFKPAIISRGYRADRQRAIFAKLDAESAKVRGDATEANASPRRSAGAFDSQNDEARELALLFPAVPHFQGANRVEVARALLAARPDVDIITLDDAFQHRRARRDLNVVLLDALNPFGGGRLLPAGLLREPLSSLRRADVVLLNRADATSAERRVEIRAQVERWAPNAFWTEIAQIPQFIRTTDSRDFDAWNVSRFPNEPRRDGACDRLASFERVGNEGSGARDGDSPKGFADVSFWRWREAARGRRFVAFCGLGAPEGFRRTLERAGIETTAFIEFADHCAYGPAELARLSAIVESTEADGALTTTKDWVKLTTARPGGRPIFALGIGVEFLTGERGFRRLLSRFSRPAAPSLDVDLARTPDADSD